MAQSSKVFAGSTLTPTGDAAVSGAALVVAAAASYDENFQSYSVGDTPTGWTDKASATFRVALNGATKVGRMTHTSWGAAQHDGPFGQGCFVADLLTSSGAGSSQSSHVVRFVNGSASGHLRQVMRSAADTLYLDIPANYIGHNSGVRLSSFPIPTVPAAYKTNTADLTGQQLVSLFKDSTLLGTAILTAAAKYQGNSVCLHGINGTTDYSRLRFYPTKTGGFTSPVWTPYAITSVTRIQISARLAASYIKAQSGLFEYRLDSGSWMALPDTGYINAACSATIEVRASSTLKNNLDASSDLQVDSVAIEIAGQWDATEGAPGNPAGLTATAEGWGQVALAWADGAGTGWQLVLRSTSSNVATAEAVGAVAAGLQAFTDTGLEPGTLYYYWLQPFSSDGVAGGVTGSASATTISVGGDRPLANRDRQTPLLKAIYGVLGVTVTDQGQAKGFTATVWNKATKAWAAAVVPYYQDVPDNAPYPFAALGGVTETAWNTKTAPGSEFLVTLVLVSQYEGAQELANIGQAVLDALTASPLDLSASGLKLVQLRPLASGGSGGLEKLSDGRTQIRRVPLLAKVQDLTQQTP